VRAVVFAYSNVGDRCLRVLRAQGMDIPLVVTHHDNPREVLWYECVADTAHELGLQTMLADDPKDRAVLERVKQAQPDFIFSFYYRAMIPTAVLSLARAGAFNMHGSMLPKYRGRAPTNWAVVHGETQTGATLHEMVAKPDAGAIVDQLAVPILPDDTAQQVFTKVTVAAEQVLWRSLPLLVAGKAPRLPNPLGEGSYFSGRTPEDGLIDWSLPAGRVYNLIRGVAPPYPGAFEMIAGKRVVISKARLMPPSPSGTFTTDQLGLTVADGKMLGHCGDSNLIDVQEVQVDGEPINPTVLASMLLARQTKFSA
jgi:methionyl-tRNA formyltransferase